jgi:hypothetical protein
LELLIRKKADIKSINLQQLYNLQAVKYNIQKLKLFSDNSMDLDDEMEEDGMEEGEKFESIYIILSLFGYLNFAKRSSVFSFFYFWKWWCLFCCLL